MQPIPTPEQTDEKLDRIRDLTTKRIKVRDAGGIKTELANIDILADRIHRHLELERTHHSQPDGYRTTASGNGNGTGTGATISVTNRDDGSIGVLTPDRIAVTTTEAAVYARLHWRDDHRTDTLAMYTHLIEAVHHLAAMVHALDKLDLRPVPTDLEAANDDTWCINCIRYHVMSPRNTKRRSKYCTWCQDVKQDTGSYPPGPLVTKHDQGERISQQDIAAHFPKYQPKP